MSRPKGTSPTLDVELTQAMYDAAKRSRSGGCLIADAIKKQYPQFVNVSVDMATIRFSDRVRGERYTYITTPDAQTVLAGFDQGLPLRVDRLTIRRAAFVTPIIQTRSAAAAATDRSRAAMARLEAKKTTGGKLTAREETRLVRLRETLEAARTRPTAPGPREAVRPEPTSSTNRTPPTVVGGPHPRRGGPNPNLLRGTDRHFGAKIADPGVVFRDAVEVEVARRLAEISADTS